MGYGAGTTGFDGSFILFLILILLVFGMTPFFGGYDAKQLLYSKKPRAPGLGRPWFFWLDPNYIWLVIKKAQPTNPWHH